MLSRLIVGALALLGAIATILALLESIGAPK